MIYSEDSRSDWRTVDLAGSDGGFDWLTVNLADGMDGGFDWRTGISVRLSGPAKVSTGH
jgi:hypothetical protein